MAAIDVKINQEKNIDNKIDRDLKERKHRERLCKLRGHIIEYLEPQLAPQDVLKVLNDSRVYYKVKMMRRNK